MKIDTKFGNLLDVAFGHRYGEGFQWKSAVIANNGNGNYVVEINTALKEAINPAVVCFQMCKHLKHTTNEDGEFVDCGIEGKCPLGKWEPVIKV